MDDMIVIARRELGLDPDYVLHFKYCTKCKYVDELDFDGSADFPAKKKASPTFSRENSVNLGFEIFRIRNQQELSRNVAPLLDKP
jgi:hypothetical protein